MRKRTAAWLLALFLLLSACGGGRASSMKLARTEGAVGVSDEKGQDIQVREALKLYSGYGVDTQAASYAWIDLDQVKLAKLDEDSQVQIQSDGKALEIVLDRGSVFFTVTEPLAEDETMTIRTANMSIGIRGTCGWVSAEAVYVLEGTVTAVAAGTKKRIQGGEMAMVAEGKTTVRAYAPEEIAPFVMAELEENQDLREKILEETGIDVLAQAPPEQPAPLEPSDQTDQLKQPDQPEQSGAVSGRLVDSGEWEDIQAGSENITICGTAAVKAVVSDDGNIHICGNAAVGTVITNGGNVWVYENAAVGDITTDSGNVEIYGSAVAGGIQTGSGNIEVRDDGMIGTAATDSGRIER